jgi:uncharacterized protein with HEPN domain
MSEAIEKPRTRAEPPTIDEVLALLRERQGELRERGHLYAVVRALEIVSEASRRLPEETKRRHGAVARRRIAGAGNVYRHDYGSVSTERVRQTATEELDALEEAARRLLAEREAG